MDLRNCNIKIDFPHVYFKLFYNFHKKNYPMRIQIIIYCRNYNHSHICVGVYVEWRESCWGLVPLRPTEINKNAIRVVNDIYQIIGKI